MKKYVCKFVALTLVMLLSATTLSACAVVTGESLTTTQTTVSAQNTTTATSIISTTYDVVDTDELWDAATATQITLQDSGITVTGTGASASGSVLTITQAGTYVLSGTLTNGQINVKASKNDTVRIVLAGVQITNQSGAAIYASQADKLIITLAPDTQNTVTDGGSNFSYTLAADEEPDAAIFSKCDLTLNGAGALTVNAGFKNGIGTKDDLVISNGQITINAANDGLRGRDSITILGGVFNITAQSDGMQSNDDTDATKGWISIENGTITINAGHDGIQAQTALSIASGDITITTANRTTVSDSDSYKGLKAGTNLTVSGGNLTINSVDDCINADGNIVISGGNLSLTSGDDGIHANTNFTITSGTVNVLGSYEGIEAANLYFDGGVVRIVASDDGINAAGGNDGGMGGRFGQDPFSSSSSGSYTIAISGGDIALVAGGDGVDSNGSITISGGIVSSMIKSSSDNGAMDCDGTLTISGGTVIYGGTGIGQTSSGSDTSYLYVTGTVSANTTLSVQQNGATLLTFTVPISVQSLVIASPLITSGQSYNIYSGSTLAATVTAGTGGQNGMNNPGGGGGGGKRR